MKKSVILLAFMLLFFSAFVSAEIEVIIRNSSLVDTNYTLGSSISGLLNLSLKNVPANAMITSNLGGKIYLRDFLKANGQQLPCESFDCSSTYTAFNGGTSRNFNYPTENTFGFQINNQKNVQITSVKFNMSSDFPFTPDNTVPVTLKIFDNYTWKFEEPSVQFDRFYSYGCYDATAPQESSQKTVSSIKYCEQISNLPSSKSYMLGADIHGTGAARVFMDIKSTTINTDDAHCDFIASNASSCNFTLKEALPAGEYLVCISADNVGSYSFSSEKAKPTCGYYSDDYVDVDFPIFVRVPRYASSASFNLKSISNDEFNGGILAAANRYLTNKYNGDCSTQSGCVLPIEISGVSQLLTVSNVQIGYSAKEGATTTNNVYSLSSSQILQNFPNENDSGVVDLHYLDFKLNSTGNKQLILYIDGKELLKKDIQVLSAPVIGELNTLTALAGVPTTFTVGISSSLNVSSYKWNFGDGKTENTLTNSVSHVYENNTFYNLQVSAIDTNGVTASKNFTIIAGNPSEVIGFLITSKKAKLEAVSNSLNTYPIWEADSIKKTIKLAELMDIVQGMEQRKNTVFTDAEMIKLALELNSLVIPQRVYIIQETPAPFLINEADVDPAFISEISGDSSEEDSSGYTKGIVQWEQNNVQGLIVEKKIGALMDNNASVFVTNVYSIKVISESSEESYFIVNKNFDQITPDGTFDFKKGNGYSYLVIAPNEEKNFEFISPFNETLKIYVSPDTKNLPYDAPLGVCNFNLVCEKELGENYQNCRNDCKPVARTFIWVFLLVFVVLGIYTGLQIWYKRRYETALFVDRAQLFNLVSYIDSMRNRNIQEGLIRNKLAEQGWSAEQINYAVKKSKGQNTGMYELIPVEKILYLLRDRKSKVEAKANPILVPAVPRRNMPMQNTNFNKPGNLKR